ncbi:hypothetical protein [Catenulispora subtropica]|uniref:Uncharacterized protein n=1 Tax=Catenulispora subtropica TaxID=450798 RepID=A0ABP5C6L3_9ACTN
MKARSRAGPDPVNPFAPDWTETGLRPLADRAHSGESPARLGDELLTQLWPWAVRTAEQMARRLPPGADRDALRGEVLLEVFQATRRIDWDRYRTWPALLRSRLRNAWSAAARAEDPLSRGQRGARRAFLAAEEELTHRLRRTPTPAERLSLAIALSPHAQAAPVLLGTSATARDPETLLGSASVVDDDPAVHFERRAARQAVRAWIDQDLPPRLAAELKTVLAHDAGDRISRELLRQLKPFLDPLRRRLAQDSGAHASSDGAST